MYNDSKEVENYVKICFYILNGFMILIGIYLAFLFIKSKALHTYSCYNIIIMSTTILLDNIIRIIPTNSLPVGYQYAQATFLVLFDKIIIAILCMQIIVVYIGIIKTEIYEKNQKKIFIFGILLSLIISGTLTTLYMTIPKDKLNDNDMYFYCNTSWDGKKILDSIFNGVLLGINIFCSAVVLAHFIKMKKAAESGAIQDLGYKQKCIRFLVLFSLNILMNVEQFLIIYKKLPGNVDIIYLTSCLIIDLCFSMNDIVIKETLRIICRKKPNNPDDPYFIQLKKLNTYGVETQEDEDDN